MMQYKNELSIKKIIGILSEYYRATKYKIEKNKNSTWRVENFLQDENGIVICSRRTYSRITKGQLVMDDDIYSHIIKKLSLKIYWNNQLNLELEKLTEKIIENVLKQNFNNLHKFFLYSQNMIVSRFMCKR